MDDEGSLTLPDGLEDRLREVLQGRVVFMGVGNILRGDDAVGPELAGRLASLGMRTVDAGTVPESYIRSVGRFDPDTVVIIDAVHLDREPGSVELLTSDDLLGGTGFTTHTLSPELVMDRIREETGAEVFLLAIQPAGLSFGAPLSAELEALLSYLPGRLARLSLSGDTAPRERS